MYLDGKSRVLEAKKAQFRANKDSVLVRLISTYLPTRPRAVNISRVGWIINAKFEMDWFMADQSNIYLPFSTEEIYDIWISKSS